MQIITANHWTKPGYPYGRARVRTEEAEGDCNLIGRTIASTNWICHSSQRLSHQPKSTNWLVQGPRRICSRGLTSLASVEEYAPFSSELLVYLHEPPGAGHIISGLY